MLPKYFLKVGFRYHLYKECMSYAVWPKQFSAVTPNHSLLTKSNILVIHFSCRADDIIQRGNSKCIFSQKNRWKSCYNLFYIVASLYPASLVHSCSWIFLILVSNAPLFLFFLPFYKMLLLYFNWFDHHIFQSSINRMFGVNKLILVIWNYLWS